MKKILIILTSTFPYDDSELFLSDELKYLSTHFEKIYLIPLLKVSKITHELLPNCQTAHLEIDKKFSGFSKILNILSIFNKSNEMIVDEIQYIFKNKLKQKNLDSVIRNYVYASKIANKIQSFIKTIDKNAKDRQIFLYSYWNDICSTALAILKKKFPQYKVFCRAHAWDIYFYRHNEFFLPFITYKITNLDKTFMVSQNGSDYLHYFFKGINPSKISVSYLGIINNKKNFHSESIRQRSILSISYTYKLKRIDLIGQALKYINFKINWFHIGKYFNFLNEFSSLINELKAKGVNVKFLGEKTREEVFTFLENTPIDLLINVSEAEGLPVSMMEAMSCGIPCIGTNVGGVSEIIEDGYNGFLLPPNPTPQEVADKITYFYNLPIEEKHILRKNAHTTWKEKFNAEINYPLFIDEILKL